MKLNLQYPTFPDLTHPNGYLPNDKRAQACWYFYTIAQKAKEDIGESTEDQILLETDRWMDPMYENQARSVALMYQLESPDEFLKFFGFVEKQALDMGLPRPSPKYMRPLRIRVAS